jgi:hypothetical protein
MLAVSLPRNRSVATRVDAPDKSGCDPRSLLVSQAAHDVPPTYRLARR